ncbi:MAG TPA: signal peptide peptidase SppA [Flavisolibacter sp.]|nr:signal peptide peptidase SppA [Flavisolibacter sp.]
MRSFFKIFFASLLSLIIFALLFFFIIAAIIGGLASKSKPELAPNSVLVLDLSKTYAENAQASPMNVVSGDGDEPNLHTLIQLIHHAKTDDNIAGIYIQANGNANGFGASNEIRQALIDFKRSKKFVIAYGDVLSQQSYFVASAADKVYLNPQGYMEWQGLSVTIPFIKGTLDKLEIQPQIFYAGKFKSATEPLRATQMSPENKLQTTIWLSSLYSHMLQSVSQSRKIDTATLHNLATTVAIQTPADAVSAKLIDGTRYDDQVRSEMKRIMKLGKYDKLNFVPTATYNDAVSVVKTGKDRIALIIAEGTIVDGEGSNENIGAEKYRAIIRKARLDKNVKAIVLRVNSGGGSAMASEIIWRELHLARVEDKKPVIVSFGDVAASGGYYIACGADSIFANPNTLTGSIGVFGIIPNMQSFFNNKLGVTFDEVKTAPYADAGNVVKPLNEKEKELVQNSINRIYLQFKQRVSEGRKKDLNYIEEVAQGRVWSGEDALKAGLVDRLANLDDAIAAAARMAKLTDYGVKQYPESEGWLKNLLNQKKKEPAALIKEQIGVEHYKTFQQVMQIKEMTNSIQARLPFEIILH